MKVDGGCFCGQVKFEAEVDPAQVRLCHCTDCQIASGTAYRVNVPVPKDKMKLTGTLKTHLKTAESGSKRLQMFCPECGTSIYSCADQDPQSYTVRVGTIRQRAQLAPKMQQWCRSELPWAGDILDLPRFEKQRPA